jgi:Tfp pilus assembly protein PilN
VRPVNLLPESSRPARATGARSGSAYVVVGVLVAALVMVVGYVAVSNQISTRESEIATAQQELAAAQQQTGSLSSYANFLSIKETRLQSVKQLATQRLDWERALREIALLLPRDAWITELDGATTPSADSASGAAGNTPAGPEIKLAGCAPSQERVATMLVRLREMNGVTDVELSESTQQDSAGSGMSVGSDSAGSGSSSGCPDKRFRFDVTVRLAPAAPPQDAGRDTVPARLGGGP